MATLLTLTAATGTSKKVSNSLSLLWRGQGAMMHKPAHPLVTERRNRTPSFEWVTQPRHQRIYAGVSA